MDVLLLLDHARPTAPGNLEEQMIRQIAKGRWRMKDSMGFLWFVLLLVLGAIAAGSFALYYGVRSALSGRFDIGPFWQGAIILAVGVAGVWAIWRVRRSPSSYVDIDQGGRTVTVVARRKPVQTLSFAEALPVRVKKIASHRTEGSPHYEVYLAGREERVYMTPSKGEAERHRAELERLLTDHG
jgi:hypothetical protein